MWHVSYKITTLMIRVNLFFLYPWPKHVSDLAVCFSSFINEAVISQRNIKQNINKPSKNLKNLKKTKQIYYVILKMTHKLNSNPALNPYWLTIYIWKKITITLYNKWKKICEKKNRKKRREKIIYHNTVIIVLIIFFAFDLERRKYTQNMCCPAQNVLGY